ncbi:MAG: nucleotidyltransferase domain-containing protein [Flexibacteraceae bacterium]
MVTEAEIQDIVDKLVEGYQPEKIILFGSYAYGNPTEDSDLDLLVVKEATEPKWQRNIDAGLVVGRKPFSVHLEVLTPSEFEQLKEIKSYFTQDIVNKGLTVYVQ